MNSGCIDQRHPRGRKACREGIRIGSESCSRLLMETGLVTGMDPGINPGQMTLVTPVTGPDDFENVIELIDEALVFGFGEIVVNDWGVLKVMSRRDDTVVTAGRLLLRLRRGPGESDRWQTLDPVSRRYFAWGPLYDGPFLDFLRNHGVNRLEVDPPRHWVSPPPTTGMKLSLHCRTRLIAVSGACPWLYDSGCGRWEEEKDCGRKCCDAGDLLMEAAPAPGPFVLRGKTILERVDEPLKEEELPESVDRLIYEEK